jgi:hypothetical protein
MNSMVNEFLPGYKVSALDKNRLFNLIWDMRCSAATVRIAPFENINASTAANLRFDRSEGMELSRRVAGMGNS